ncbi:hypothetical protein B0H11DRAFT_2187157 [Mycena galericulata]|nr:hypothetical protein B0H11DRAFT_2187157 [Mycena galericulata]
MLLTVKDRDENYEYCLPVFYVNLDPAGIPTGEELATDAVRRASIALRGLQALNDSEISTGTDLWPRIWAWINFLHAYRESLPPLPVQSVIAFDLLFFIERFKTDISTAVLIKATVGTRTIVMDAWAALFESDDGENHPGFVYLCNFFTVFMQADDLAEIVEGAGGTGRVGSLVVDYLDLFIPHRQAPIPERTLFFMDGILVFLLELLDYGGVSSESISPTLLSSGVVASLVSATCAISGSAMALNDQSDGIPNLLLDIFDVLETLLAVHPAHRAIGHALDAGLLRAIILTSIACEDMEDVKSTALWKMLDTTLPAATVYYTVVTRLGARMSQVQSLVKDPAFKKSPFHPVWSTFEDVSEERIELMTNLNSSESNLAKACDNMECQVIRGRTAFRRCSSCQQVYYCSSECQRLDWIMGGHRQMCHSFRAFRHRNPDLTRRNVAFMRALIHQDVQMFTYVAGAHLTHRLSRMRERPSEPLVTVIDYTRGNAHMFVKFLADERADDKNSDILWEEHILRAAKSGGRMELHLLRVRDGDRTRRIMFPQRSDSSVLPDGLAHILSGLSEDPEGVEEIQELLAANDDLVNIH